MSCLRYLLSDFIDYELTPAYAGVFVCVFNQIPARLVRRFAGEVGRDQRYVVLK
jgi:hypothetical protein